MFTDVFTLLGAQETKIFVFRLFLALFLGALIGLERQIKQRNAGLVTNSLVSLGACIYILIATLTNNGTQDSLRVVGQIVTGIGFLGAGVIMRDGFTVHGLNSAATIWCSAAVGSLAGYGLWLQATLSAFVIVSTHLILRPLIEFIDNRPAKIKIAKRKIGFTLSILAEVKNEKSVKTFLVNLLNEYHEMKLRLISAAQHKSSGKVEIKMEILTYNQDDTLINAFTSEVMQNNQISEVSIDTLISIEKGKQEKEVF